MGPLPRRHIVAVPDARCGFTLVEVLVSFAILSLLMVVLLAMVNVTSTTWTQTRGKVEQFQQAREAFDSVTRRLSEATLNTYYDYVDTDGRWRTTDPDSRRAFVPHRYVRRSELRFLSGDVTGMGGHTAHAVFFQAPQGYSLTTSGLPNLLNTCGFFVELGSDARFLPGVLAPQNARRRFRLMQLMERSEELSVYLHNDGDTHNPSRQWLMDALASEQDVEIAAENIIALILLPKLSESDQREGNFDDASLAPSYEYDSTARHPNPSLNPFNQLPPVVQVTLVAIDEQSANRMSPADQDDLKDRLDGLFRTVGSTTDPSVDGYAKDLKSLEAYLVANNMNYRIFTSNVSMKAAKWSRDQAN
jgi:uncharacterized protein (TIGR02599 family)